MPVTAIYLALALASPSATAQSFDATHLRQSADLGVTWLVHAGDDPAYARPDFDDSHWTRLDSRASLKTVFPSDRPEILWYRLHVKVAPEEIGLELAERNISSAFEVYVNGRRILQNGRVAPYEPYTFSARLMQAIPEPEIATGSLLIAVRVHLSRIEWDTAYPGVFAGNLTLGPKAPLQNRAWLAVIGGNFFDWINQFTGFGLGIVALALFAAQRRQWEYLWIFLQFLVGALQLPLSLFELFHNVPASWSVANDTLGMVQFVFMILMYFAFLRIRFGRWIQGFLAFSMLGYAFALIGILRGSLGLIGAYIALLPLVFLLAGVIPVLLVIHFRHGNREAGILLIPVVLSSLDLYISLLLGMLSQVPAFAAASVRASETLNNLHAGPFTMRIGNLADLFYVLALAIIMVLRSTRISHQQALLEGELSAAREVQQVILPAQVEAVPGFTVESAYQPAQQVGGDFFQVLPAGDGLLVVVGDVAGKGLPAAMLVSMLIGAIRTAADYTRSPEEVLAQLNERLLGRTGGGFCTALVAHIAAHGWVTIANAGHLSPYLDGQEVALPGALPLGVVNGANYETTQFHLAHSSRLTFYSDGVVEAKNSRGELFGFDRGKAISTQPAADIVQAAIQFGQSDDITVVAIERLQAIATAA